MTAAYSARISSRVRISFFGRGSRLLRRGSDVRTGLDLSAHIRCEFARLTVPEAQAYRIARADQPMTMELLQELLTFMLDPQGKLLSIRCG